LPEPRRSVLWALAFAFEACSTRDVLLGQGADELFGGYAHFEGLTPPEAVQRSESDWRQLIDQDWPATIRLATQIGRTAGSPYLDGEVSGYVRSLPIPRREFGGERKALLRAVGRSLGVPEALLARPKRAMQYGTRIAKEIQRLSVADGLTRGPRSGSRPPPAGPGAATAHR
jgi:asparagine synthase (glutamine-hydrolysing)